MNQSELTVKEYAARERVTERTVRNWIAKGALPVRRNPGGRHLRIAATFVCVKNEEPGGSERKR
jgi:excisionase family DNA binding protein